MPEWFSPALSAGAFVLMLFNTLGGRTRDTEARLVSLDERVKTQGQMLDSFAERLKIAEKDINFAAGYAAAQQLHRENDEYRMDRLIEKYQHGSLTRDELYEFVELLNVVRDTATDDEGAPHIGDRRAAETMLRVLAFQYGLEQ
jgi:hypothetical protein